MVAKTRLRNFILQFQQLRHGCKSELVNCYESKDGEAVQSLLRDERPLSGRRRSGTTWKPAARHVMLHWTRCEWLLGTTGAEFVNTSSTRHIFGQRVLL